jgi:hypothetical protein
LSSIFVLSSAVSCVSLFSRSLKTLQVKYSANALCHLHCTLSCTCVWP